ncbi:MAG: hypothetical protein ACM36C_04960 [Acidobacteriota bacterium]
MARWIVALVCCLALAETSLAAAQDRQEREGLATSVIASAPAGPLVRSALLKASQTPLRAEAAFTAARSRNSQEGSWIQRHPVMSGTLIGFGAGFGLAYAAAKDDQAVRALLYGGASAGVGALIGWGIERSRNDNEPDYMRSPMIR